MRTILVIAVAQLMLFPAGSRAACTLQHAITFGDTSVDAVYDSALDPDGRLVIAGSFLGTVTIDGLPPLVGAGSDDFLLAVFEPDGTPVWAKRFGASNVEIGFGVDTDAAGNIVVAGLLLGSADLGGGTLTAFFYDMFLAKYDRDGNHLWSQLVGSVDFDFPWGVAVAPNGDIALMGGIDGPLPPHDHEGSTDIYIARFDSSGALLYDEVYGTFGYDPPGDVAFTTSGDLLFTGGMAENTQVGSFNVEAGDVFLAKADPTGAVQWVTTWAGDGEPVALAVAPGDTIYFGGAFHNSAAPGLTGGPYLGQGDWFVAQVDPVGNLQWILNGGTSRRDIIEAIAVKDSGDIVVTGGVEIGDHERLLLASYGPDRTLRFEKIYADAADGDDRGRDVVVNGNGEMIVSGTYEGLLNICSDLFTGAGETDGFVIRLGTPEPVRTPDLPTPAWLGQNHPNPFNPSTTIRYRVARSGPVTLDIFDAAGRRVRRLVAGSRPAGEHQARWDGRDESGRALPSGAYRYRLEAPSLIETRSMVLVR